MNAEHKTSSLSERANADARQQTEAGARPIASWDRRSNMLAVVLMALATLGSSWSAYQSSLWNGIQIFHLNDAAKLSRDADEKTTVAGQQRGLDTALFVLCARDFFEGKRLQVEFILRRMRPDFRQAVEAWMATEPRTNPDAPSTPFAMPQYHQWLADEARELEKRSGEVYSQARYANSASDTYTLIGVLYTSALFLAGLISAFDQKQVRRILLALSFSILVLAMTIMGGQPVAHHG